MISVSTLSFAERSIYLVEYAQIDWHDFVVVETVLFNEADDQADLPPPTSLNDLQSASLEQKAMMSLQPHNMRIEEAMPTDEVDAYYDPYSAQQSQIQQMQPSPIGPTPTAPYPTFAQPISAAAPPPPPVEDDEESRLINERTAARAAAQAAQAAAKTPLTSQPLRIRNDYVPRAQAKRQTHNMALCPNCKQQIPFDELEQHMRSTSCQALVASTFRPHVLLLVAA